MKYSGSALYSAGNPYACQYSARVNASQGDVQMQPCMVEFTLLLGESALPTIRGFCMPAVCSNADVADLVHLMSQCSMETNSYLDRCVTPKLDALCGNNTKCKVEVENLVHGVKQELGNISGDLVLQAVQCGSVDTGPMSGGAIFMVIIAVGLGVLAAAAYIYERADRLPAEMNPEVAMLLGAAKEAPSTPVKSISKSGFKSFVLCFSVRDNIANLVAKEPTRSIATLDAMRTISMFYIVLGHTADFMLPPKNYYQNMGLVFEKVTDFRWMALVGAQSCVDTFFFISGLLTAYSLLRRAVKGGGIPILKFTLLRYLRLVPLVAVVVGFYASLVRYSGNGTMWYKMVADSENCQDTWWSNLLFINNFYPSEFDDQCIPWAWYLAVDMQLFVVGLVLLVLYLRHRLAGVAVTSFLVVLGIVLMFVVDQKEGITLAPNESQQNALYDKPYTRMPAYMLGLLFGYLMTDVSHHHLHVPPIVAHVILLVSTAAIVIMCYSMYWATRASLGVTATGAYYAFLRVCWSLCIGAIVLLCSTGQGMIWADFLTLRMWEPLGKLTFGAYLVHPIVIRMRYHSTDVTNYHTTFNFAMDYCGFLLISYVAATVLYVLVEVPSANLIAKLIRKAPRPSKNTYESIQ